MRSPKRTLLLATLTLGLTVGSGAAIAASHNSTPAKQTSSTAATTSPATTTTTTPTTTTKTPTTPTPKTQTTPKSQSSNDKCQHPSSTSSTSASGA
jgi:hypothetical protein